MKRTPWVLAMLVVSLGLPACGGKSSPGPTALPTPVVVASPTPAPTPTPEPSPSPEPSPTPEPPAPKPSPTPSHDPTPPPPPPPSGPPPDLIINIVGMSYSPSSASVQVGQKVIWRNTDTSPHTATADGGAFNTGIIAPGGQSSVTMTSAGNFPYHCNIHPTMTGTVSVSP